MTDLCPVCRSHLDDKTKSPGGRDVTLFSCPQCGDFTFSGTLVACIQGIMGHDKDSAAKISHALRTMQEVSKGSELYNSTIEEILKRPLPSPKEQVDLFIRWLARHIDGPGEKIYVGASTHSAIIGAKSPEGFEFILQNLLATQLVEGSSIERVGRSTSVDLTLTLGGWEYSEKLLHGSGTYRKAFMAMKFGEPILDSILLDVFKPAVRQAGFELSKLDDQPKAGLIDDRMRVEIQASDFIIADLTHDNLGAYWEAGYAEGLGKPVIYTCEKQKFRKDKTHFDTNHHLTIIWDKDSPSDAAEMLKATIRATLPQLAKQQDD